MQHLKFLLLCNSNIFFNVAALGEIISLRGNFTYNWGRFRILQFKILRNLWKAFILQNFPLLCIFLEENIWFNQENKWWLFTSNKILKRCMKQQNFLQNKKSLRNSFCSTWNFVLTEFFRKISLSKCKFQQTKIFTREFFIFFRVNNKACTFF